MLEYSLNYVIMDVVHDRLSKSSDDSPELRHQLPKIKFTNKEVDAVPISNFPGQHRKA